MIVVSSPEHPLSCGRYESAEALRYLKAMPVSSFPKSKECNGDGHWQAVIAAAALSRTSNSSRTLLASNAKPHRVTRSKQKKDRAALRRRGQSHDYQQRRNAPTPYLGSRSAGQRQSAVSSAGSGRLRRDAGGKGELGLISSSLRSLLPPTPQRSTAYSPQSANDQRKGRWRSAGGNWGD